MVGVRVCADAKKRREPMRLIEKTAEMRAWSESERKREKRIVLVPTMGHLHEGHLALVRQGRGRGERLVVSIFVNPAQFAPGEDYTAYPRDLDRDMGLLDREGVDVVFAPAAREIYPSDYRTRVEVEQLGDILCGGFRPGHFRGVATVVTKLFNIVRPHAAIFGEKDYQQLKIIQRLVADLNLDVKIWAHPTVREIDGLALSSRNLYLAPEERRAAAVLFRSLRRAAALFEGGERRSMAIVAAVKAELATEPLARMEYVEMRDAEDLGEIETASRDAVVALAVWVGKARLIDNLVLRA
jgi:pantoate--beta-alanine ligase